MLDETLTTVRTRPRMYMPGPRPVARWFMLLELLSNALDEWLAGRARTVRITLRGDAEVEVEDDGGGISLERLRDALARVHERATLDGDRVHVQLAAPRGVGLAVVCALSESLEVDTCDGVTRARWSLARGEPSHEPNVGPADRARGTRVRAVVDGQLYEPATGALHPQWAWRVGDVAGLARRLADYAPGLKIHCEGRLHVGTGLVERARRLGASEQRPLLVRTASEGGAHYRLVVGWRDDGGASVEELVGNYRVAAWNDEGWIGTALESYAKHRGLGPAWRLADGRIALSAIEEPSMKWGSATGDCIIDPAHRRRVRALLYAALDELCGSAPADALAFARVAPR